MTGSTSSNSTIAREIYALGMDLLQVGRIREAAFQFNKALTLNPNFTDASLCLGHCLHEMGQPEAALEQYNRLIATCPLLMAAWNNRGTTLLEMGKHAEAAESFLGALELEPTFHDARIALATCYQALGRVTDALTACNGVLAVDPEHAEAHWNRSLLLLLKGNYAEGWREYEWRWKKRNFTSPHRIFPKPLWRGESATEKTILVHAEQGFGDTLQFCRYIPLLASRNMRVIFECHPPLQTLMKSLGPGIEVIAMGQPLPDFDLHVPLMSLPLLFGTTLESVPQATPYLFPDANSLSRWQDLLSEDTHYKVGICWAGKSYPDPRRSCPARDLIELATVEAISWYSLQIGWKEALPFSMNDLTDNIRDFNDTAALISSMDLVISIDTSIAHLAGALGKPAWVMLPHTPDWRWLEMRQDSPWYPTLRLFRQAVPKEWHIVIQQVKETLECRQTAATC